MSIANLDAEIEAILPDGTIIASRKHTRIALSFLGDEDEYLNSMIRLKEGATITVAISYDYFDADDEVLKQVTHLSYKADHYLCH